MSIRTKNPCGCAGSTMRRRFSRHRSRSTSSPSCVSLSEMLRVMPEATIASSMWTYSPVAAAASSSVETLSPR